MRNFYAVLLGLLLLVTQQSIAQKTWVGTSGSWKNPANWSGGTVPGPTDSVVITTASNSGAVITLDTNATIRALYMVGTGNVANSGPILQYALSGGQITLTILGNLSITGGTGGGGGTNQGGRAKFTSNGNDDAVLILNGWNGATYTTTTSNTVANFSAGLNMNEGTVRIIGSGIANISAGAGLRLGNLIIGDGVNPKTVNYTQSSQVTLSVTGFTVRTNATFNAGGTANGPTLGSNNVAGVSNLTRGILIENGGAFITQPSSATTSAFINVFAGDFINNGTLLLSNTNRTYTVVFGNTITVGRTRILGGTNAITFHNLTIQDTSSIIDLSDSILISGTLTLNRGIIQSSTANPVILTATGTVAGGGNLAYINGPCTQRWTTTTSSKLFPIGKNGFYRPLAINLTTPTNPIISAELFTSGSGGSMSGGIVSTNFHYQASLVSGTAATGGTVTINYLSPTDGVQNMSSLVVAQSATLSGTYTNLGKSADTVNRITSVSYNPANGQFITLGSTSGNTLPVNYKDIRVSSSGNSNLLHWSTASEQNNRGFDVQRSQDGQPFETVAFVKGLGNSNSTTSYSYIDSDIDPTVSYCYRLKQVDFDGATEYSKTVCAAAHKSDQISIGIQPNPFHTELSVVLNTNTESNATIELVDLVGKVVAMKSITVSKSNNNVHFDTNHLNNGIYFVRINQNGHVTVRKIVKR